GHLAGDLVAPEELAVQVQGDRDAGTEVAIDPLAVGDGRRHRIDAVTPRIVARRDRGAPEFLAVRRLGAGDPVFRDLLVILLLVGLLARHHDEPPVAPDDRAGIADAAQRHLPEQVFLGLAVPAQRQVGLLTIAHAGRTAPARPVAGLAHVSGGKN